MSQEILHNGKTEWILPDKEKLDPIINQMKQLNCFQKYDDEILYFLAESGIRTKDDYAGLNDENLSHLIDPRTIKDAEKLVDIIADEVSEKHKLGKKLHVTTYTDFDCDGIFSGIIYNRCLPLIFGSDKIETNWWINDRFNEGYNYCKQGVDKLVKKAPETDLILTGDNGIRMGDSATYTLQKYGIKTLLTDHHLPAKDKQGNELLPKDCLAIVDMHQKAETAMKLNPQDKGLPDECGAEIALHLMLLAAKKYNPNSYSLILSFADMAGAATLADVMPLYPHSENRILVKTLLRKLNSRPTGQNSYGSRVGFRAILDQFRIQPPFDSTTVAFDINPMINSSARMLGTADLAMRIFLSNDRETVYSAAQALYSVNEDRKKQVREEVDKLYKGDSLDKSHKIIVAYLPGVNPGIAGIIASKILDREYKPVIVITKRDQDAQCKGSARSIDGFNITDAILEAGSEFSENDFACGGHAEAAGLTCSEGIVKELTERLYDYADKHLSEDVLTKKMRPNFIITDDTARIELVDQIKKLDPFGNGFEEPMVLYKDAKPLNVSVIGKNNPVHIGLNMPKSSIVDWYGKDFFENKFGEVKDFKSGTKLSAIGTLDKSLFNSLKPQLKVNNDEMILA